MRLFKKLFKENKVDIITKDEVDIINSLSSENKAEESIVRDESSGKTNRLPELYEKIAANLFNTISIYQFYSYSDLGKVRKNNEDSIFTASYKFHIANEEVSSGMGIVADGMGGLDSGEAASKSAIASVSTYMYARLSEYIEKEIPTSETILNHMAAAIQNANTIVKNKGEELVEEIGTTLTALFLLGNVAYFGHVGDSRAYVIDTKRESIEKVTRDHSLVGKLVEMGELSEEQAKSHPRRNEIYRMLGLRKEIEVDTFYRIVNKDSIILLMSDGLWEFVEDSIILHEILNSNNLLEAAKKLIQRANNNGGLDNISIVIVKAFE